jgi:phosphate acyltransferase
MTDPVVISLDAMGGDHGPSVVIPAAVDVLKAHPQLKVILVGRETVLRDHLGQLSLDGARSRIEILHASEVVEMTDSPSQALRGKKDSSMRVAINLVKDGRADACVSAGNTGALMATARFVLKTLPGIDRPAIIAAIPSRTGHTHMLDLGANADCEPEHLLQFAVMGAVIAECVHGVPSPRVGLLNIGEEAIKGTEEIKLAGAMLAESDVNYVGFVEGTDIFTGELDVVVTDGFTGNVALKSIEGVAKLFGAEMKDALNANILTKFLALMAMPILRRLKNRLNPKKYNGASLVGLRGIVLKSHGSADRESFANAIEIAVTEVEKQVPVRIEDRLAHAFEQGAYEQRDEA